MTITNVNNNIIIMLILFMIEAIVNFDLCETVINFGQETTSCTTTQSNLPLGQAGPLSHR